MSRDGWAALPRGVTGCLQFVIVVFPDHTHLLFLMVHMNILYNKNDEKEMNALIGFEPSA